MPNTKMSTEKSNFINTLKSHQKTFELNLNDNQIENLYEYYKFVEQHNKLLHLTAPCSLEEFITKHLLESLLALHYFPSKASIVDIGAGAGLPSIPCLLVRTTLNGFLVESKPKKAAFLQNAVEKFKLENRVQIINKQFKETNPPQVSFLVCRALDKFSRNLPHIIRWAGNSSILLFAGNNLRETLNKQNVSFDEKLIPKSKQRFLFYINLYKKEHSQLRLSA